MNNEEIAKRFEQLAQMMEIRGDEFYRIRSYRNAAEIIREWPTELRDIAAEEGVKGLQALPGIGKAISGKTLEMLERGTFEAWEKLARLLEEGDHWPMLMPSQYARPSATLDALMRELHIDDPDGRDPLSLVYDVSNAINSSFAYVKKSTAVNSPIETSLESRQGVCQDFAHIMIAALRRLRIPCRYVSGYLHHDELHEDRSAEGATHAWVEALLPGLGWMGFDPTNGGLTAGRHIRTAVGRDYADVPPTIGTMKGRAETELQVRVRVAESQALLPQDEDFAADEEWSLFLESDEQALLFQQEQQ